MTRRSAVIFSRLQSFLIAVCCLGAQCLLTAEPSAAQPAAEAASDAAMKSPKSPESSVFFVDVTKDVGITFEHQSAPEKKYILESMSGGVAVLDFDGDDDLDIYFVNSLTVDTADQPKTAPSALYRNLGVGPQGLEFEDVAVKAGVAYPGWGVGVCGADFDADGHPDLYVTGVGHNVLYRNRGDGTFEDVTEARGVAAGGWSAGCGFADYDRDGDLDLFVSRYVEVDMNDLPEFGKGKSCLFRGVAVQCGPRGLPGTPDLLYRNDGDKFTEVGKAAGVDDPDGYFGLGVAFFDATGDGWLDLFVANDATPNFLYVNQKDGTFVEDAFPLGVAVSEDGAEQGGMGVAVGDLENRGLFDLFVANFAEEYNAVFRNEKGFFNDVSFRSGTGAASLPYVGWGTVFFDADNDADLDLIVVNGHVYPQLDQAKLGASAPYRQRKLFYLGDGRGGFEEVGERYGEAFTELRVSRGLAAGDLDGDGRVDLVINDLDGAPQVLMNRYESPGHWLLVELDGDGKNPDAIGATVAVTTGTGEKAVTQTRLVQSGASYLSQHDLRQHFGLGSATKAESIVVTWPDGSTTTKTGVAADQRIVVSKE